MMASRKDANSPQRRKERREIHNENNQTTLRALRLCGENSV
jgi:hypothetical protein